MLNLTNNIKFILMIIVIILFICYPIIIIALLCLFFIIEFSLFSYIYSLAKEEVKNTLKGK